MIYERLRDALIAYNVFMSVQSDLREESFDRLRRFDEYKKTSFQVIYNLKGCFFLYDPYGIRTRVTAVKGRCLNRLTKGPKLWRRRRDSNPRTAYAIYALSRGTS